MKDINIQLQPNKSSLIKKENVIELLLSQKIEPEINEGSDNGAYININFSVGSVSEFWRKTKSLLLKCPGLKQSAIIVCEGSQSWDNYLLLYHFDSTEVLDNVPLNY